MLTRPRQGDVFMETEQPFPLEQQAALELPLGYTVVPVPDPNVAVVLHAYHINLLAEIRAYLNHIPFAADVFISTNSAAKRDQVAACFANWHSGSVIIEITPNRGRDIAPKLVGFAAMYSRYEYVLHLHTKQSLHEDRLVGWRGYLFDTLLGSPETVRGIFAAFAAAPNLGILAPQHIEELRPWIRWLVNYDQAASLAMRMGFELPLNAPLDFPSGSMFWARTAALRPLLDLHLTFDDFPEERAQTDGTMAHAIERLYYFACEQAGFDWMKITAKGELHDQSGVVAVDSEDQLKRFLTQKKISLTALRETTRPDREAREITTTAPKPRRVTHVLWREALGETAAIPAGLRTIIVARGTAATATLLLRDAHLALRALPAGGVGEVITGTQLSLSEAFATGFSSGADLVLVLSSPGILHPTSVAALIRMAQANQGEAIMEVACIPDLQSKQVDPENFALTCAGGPALALTRSAFEKTNGFDKVLKDQPAAIDLSQRAKGLGIPILRCQKALFYPLTSP